MRKKLTDRFIRSLATEKSQQDFYDKDFSGGTFLLRVMGSGRKTFRFMYKDQARKTRSVPLGIYPSMSLAEARRLAREEAVKVARGENPAEARRADRRIARRETRGLFKELALDYMHRHAIPKKRPSSAREDQRILDTYLVAAWGGRPYAEIRRSDVISLLDDLTIRRGAPVMANRVRALVSRIFSFAIEKELLPEDAPNPVQRLRPNEETSRERVLSNDEIRGLWKLLDERPGHMPLIYKFILATAQRSGEVKGMSWDEIGDDLWTIPSARTKNKKEHTVPLSTLAQELLESVAMFSSDGGWIFPSDRSSSGHIERMQKSNVRLHKILGFHFTPHDLRRTVSTQMSEMGIDDVIIAKILNHTWADREVTSVYNRNKRLPEVRKALERWASRLRQIISGEAARIVPIGR